MSNVSIFGILFLVGVVTPSPQGSISGFTFIGHSSESFYYLSNADDKRSVADARTGCHDSFHNGELVAVETVEEHQDVRRRLSSWGITDKDRVWTTGQYYDAEWVWYHYVTNEITPIEDACRQPWVGGICPTIECLAIGGRDLSYKWEADDCNKKRRYLCESRDDCKSG